MSEQNKKTIWVIAGASRGVGAAMFLHKSKKTPTLGLARPSEAMETLRSSHSKETASSLVSVDLCDEIQTAKAISSFLPTSPAGVVLINCAATWTGGKSTLELTGADFQQSLALNFLTSVHPCQAVLNHWMANGKNYPVTIINLGATASTRGGKNSSSFAVGKSALRIYSQSMAKELGPDGVHVCHIIIDGLIDNPRTTKLNAGREEDRYLKQASLIKQIEILVEQSKDCWTFELDLRPFNESW